MKMAPYELPHCSTTIASSQIAVGIQVDRSFSYREVVSHEERHFRGEPCTGDQSSIVSKAVPWHWWKRARLADVARNALRVPTIPFLDVSDSCRMRARIFIEP
jgi:hypothetical protein